MIGSSCEPTEEWTLSITCRSSNHPHLSGEHQNLSFVPPTPSTDSISSNWSRGSLSTIAIAIPLLFPSPAFPTIGLPYQIIPPNRNLLNRPSNAPISQCPPGSASPPAALPIPAPTAPPPATPTAAPPTAPTLPPGHHTTNAAPATATSRA